MLLADGRWMMPANRGARAAAEKREALPVLRTPGVSAKQGWRKQGRLHLQRGHWCDLRAMTEYELMPMAAAATTTAATPSPSGMHPVAAMMLPISPCPGPVVLTMDRWPWRHPSPGSRLAAARDSHADGRGLFVPTESAQLGERTSSSIVGSSSTPCRPSCLCIPNPTSSAVPTMRPPHDLHPDLAPPVSTLAVVEERFRPQEADELKKRLGTSLVSKLEDMHRELALLISIYTEYRLETEQSRSRSFDLIESTFQRDMVLDKIQMLLVKLKNGASETETQDSSIVKYVLASEKTKRPRQFVARPSSRLNDNELDRIFHTIDRVEDPLALLEMDVVVDELRDILLEEQHTLASHIACLYDDIDNERAIRCNTAELSCLSSPSMQELIKFSEKLEVRLECKPCFYTPSSARLAYVSTTLLIPCINVRNPRHTAPNELQQQPFFPSSIDEEARSRAFASGRRSWRWCCYRAPRPAVQPRCRV
ncbi:uncharacterized protein BJ171DRAFT_177944 [Polychytrium aggregatum]|uniref:uncharacterized protein n=1 Tax=Polychytrium aggregatum TaxID=110093 RepID=UPI0022FF456A|nr:uncharacterized protein BJ171DRAFT_177944 [Polychytrium aggregatum]KAI9202593.1 hypothetical protein BJ171DRAFT_177944 [Polychytrium aggregatum]